MLFSCDAHKNAERSVREKYASLINGFSKISLDFLKKTNNGTLSLASTDSLVVVAIALLRDVM